MKYIRMYMNTIKADSYNHLCLFDKTILPVRTTFQVTKPPHMILLDSNENSCFFSPTTSDLGAARFFFPVRGKCTVFKDICVNTGKSTA